MNREIKFRAWDKEYNRYLYSNDLNNLCSFFAIIEGDKKRFENIEQYTGLKDKNDKEKEVYQSDLIRSCPKGYEPREIYEVVWNKERLEWGVKNKISMITSLWTFDRDFKVIGNIYENKELLK